MGAEEEQVCEEEQAVTHGLYRKGSDVQEGVVYYKFIRSKKKDRKVAPVLHREWLNALWGIEPGRTELVWYAFIPASHQ